ncbi:MAG: hypothetical protein R6W69_14240 [Anaerolineales bacterium]
MRTALWSAGILSAIVLLLSLWNMLRAGRALADWQVLVEFGAPAAYLLISGLVWSLAGLGLLAALFRGWLQTRRAGIVISVLYWVWYWADRLFIQQSPTPNLLFSAIFSVLFLAVVILLWLPLDFKDFTNEETE